MGLMASRLQARMRGMMVRQGDLLMGGDGRAIRKPNWALADAVERGDERVFTQLVQRVSPDSFSTTSRMSALQLACRTKSQLFVRELLKASADTDMQSHDGWEQTALHVAAANDFATGVRLILAAGGNPTLVRSDGKTAARVAPAGSRTHREIRVAEDGWRNNNGERTHRNELAEAAEQRKLGAAQRLLEWRTHPDSTGGSHGHTALCHACRNADDIMASLLLQMGANPNLAPKPASPPLHLAAQAASAKCVKVLLQARANPMKRDGDRNLALFHCPKRASTTRELLLRSMAAVGGPRAKDATMEVQMHVRANGPVRELRVGDTSRAKTVANPRQLRRQVTSVDAEFEDRVEELAPSAFTENLLKTTKQGRGREGDGDDYSDASDEEQQSFRCTMSFSRCGLSIIDEEPREILYLSLSCLNFDMGVVGGKTSAEVSLKALQIDNALMGSAYPVLLASKHAMEHIGIARTGKKEKPHTDGLMVRLSVIDAEFHSGILCVEQFKFTMHPLVLNVEQNIIGRVMRLCSCLAMDLAVMEEASVKARSSVGPRVQDGAPGRVGASSAPRPTREVAAVQQQQKSSTASEVVMEVYVRHLELDSIKAAITVKTCSTRSFHDDQEYAFSQSDLGPLSALGSFGLQDWPLELPSFKINEVFEAPASLITRAARHYILALIGATYNMLLSLDGLGNVKAVVNTLQTSLHTLRDETARGNPIGGAAIGVGGLTIGLGDWLLGSFSKVGASCSSLTAQLSGDTHFRYHRAHAQQQRPTGLLDGMRIGFKVFEEAVQSGVIGVVKEPMRAGKNKGGVVGVAKGVVGGTLSGGAKVLSGSFFLVSKTSEGLSAQLHMFSMMRHQQQTPALRVRQPRAIDGVLLPYPPIHTLDVNFERVETSDAAHDESKQVPQSLASSELQHRSSWKSGKKQPVKSLGGADRAPAAAPAAGPAVEPHAASPVSSTSSSPRPPLEKGESLPDGDDDVRMPSSILAAHADPMRI